MSHWKAILANFRNKLITGVFVAVPLVVTFWVMSFAYKQISEVGKPFLVLIFGLFGFDASNVRWLAFILTVIMFFLLGMLATNVLGKRLIEAAEQLLLRIPVVATIYNVIKQIIESLKQFNNGVKFERVAYVKYPAEGCYLLGFVTGTFIDPGTNMEMTGVLLPTSPNPMTGFLVVVESSKVINTSLTMEEATKLILSAGLVGPKTRSENASTPFSVPITTVNGIQEPEFADNHVLGNSPTQAPEEPKKR